MRDAPLYYFGSANVVGEQQTISQLQLAPTVLNLLGVPIACSMPAPVFLGR